ncbi:MAG: hypothetical protein R3F30_04730 [Planctomycetota bacterium]
MKTLLPLIALAIPASVTAQTGTFVLPQGVEKFQRTENDQSYLGRGGSSYNGSTVYVPMHIQNTFPMAEVPVTAAKVLGIAMRRNNYYGNAMYASATDLTVHMSTAAGAADQASSTFASNEGTNRAQVWGTGGSTATLNWPAAPYVNNGQQPLPFVLKIPFSNPFVLIASSGKSICIDYYITKRTSPYQSGPNTYEANLFLDATGTVYGNRTENGGYQSACKFSDGTGQGGIGYTRGGLTENGGAWYVNYTVPLNTIGVATISGYGVNTPNNPFNNPIDLTAFGAPGCKWMVGLETGFWVALKTTNYTSNASANWPQLQIPAGLKPGTEFFDQGLFIDTKANKLGLIPSWSSTWTIEKYYQPLVSTVYKHQDTTPPSTTGSVRRNFAVITEFTY